MTEVADGNPVTMSATKDTLLPGRQEGFVSSGLSPCSNAPVDASSKIRVENVVQAETPSGDGPSGKVILDSDSLIQETAAGCDEVVLSAVKQIVSDGADDLKTSLGDLQQDSQDITDSSIEEPVVDASKVDVAEELPAVEVLAVKTTIVEKCVIEVSTVEPTSVDNATVEAPAEEAPAEEVAVKADPKEETLIFSESACVQDAVPGATGMRIDAEDHTVEEKSADEGVGGEQNSHPTPLKDERQNVASDSRSVKESPLTGTQATGRQPLDESKALLNGETRMGEVVSAGSHAITSSTATGAKAANEVTRSKTGDTTAKTVDETAEKLLDEMPDRVVNQFADGVADSMADALADKLADEIADRMADEIVDKMADEMAGGIADDTIADEIADRMADEMADRMADEMADRMADEMADRVAAEMADELADEMADEMADEVIEGEYGRDERAQENEGMVDRETHEVGDMEEEVEMVEDGNKVMDDDDYEDDEGTPEEQMTFVEELERFFKRRNLEYKPPKFYGLELNVLKLWRVVSRYGGYDHVTVSKLWRTVGEEFKPPKTCTTISWSFRGFYEKALLDYERFKTGVTAPDSGQRSIQTPGYYLTNDQRTSSPATPSFDPNAGGTPGSGSGRARRDAAARAMQGWHSQRMGNGDSKEPNSKEKGSGGKHVKKERKLTNIGGNGLKRKGSNTVLERAVKAVQARGRPRLFEDSPPSNSAVTGKRSMKQQDSGRRPMKVAKVDGPAGGFDPPIVDEGPKADWVKINVHKHLDCFEIYALVPGLAREEVRIQCEPGGRLVIAGMPEDPENPWGVTPFRKMENACLDKKRGSRFNV
ncbi:uncharacterized protein [Physcomitrium patens]|uniref:ARID domain-containing protein n=1 Tax=Physcomitrium patens TaxID=3218 RepID=A0A7I4ESC0_PHYPA|nr:AT-rich interactive domain-containing protein 3-like isoform X2 [Physcomitrium patens]|eukprot:XP_024384089.1 AT-rich interactive domain-containing protein 3-like isoform X2 [Physcomitrella patens]